MAPRKIKKNTRKKGEKRRKSKENGYNEFGT